MSTSLVEFRGEPAAPAADEQEQQDTSKTPPPPAVVDTDSNTLVLKTRHD